MPLTTRPFSAFVLAACAAISLSATDIFTLPGEIAMKMKKGTKLELVWSSPEFDGSKGCRLGKLTDVSEDDASIALAFFPVALKPLVQSDAPYALDIAVVRAKVKTPLHGSSSATIGAEGRLIDQQGQVVAAFADSSTKSSSGNPKADVEAAVRGIVFNVTKDLFPSRVTRNEKSPAVMTIPQAAAGAAPPVPTAPPIPQVPTPQVAVAPAPLPPPSGPVPVAAATPPAPNAASSPAAPVTAQKPEAAPARDSLIPPHILPVMSKGKALGRVWVAPGFDRAAGFQLGEVVYRVEERNDGIDQFLPEALAGLARSDASSRLDLHVTELLIRSAGKGTSSVRLGVEGRIISKEGEVQAAFRTTEVVHGYGYLTEDCRTAARQVILAIQKDLQ